MPELQAGRLRARKLIKKYNDYLPDDATDESLVKGREAILKEVIGSVGEGVFIDPPFRVDYGCNISLGKGFYANFKSGSLLLIPRVLGSDCAKYGDSRLWVGDDWRSHNVWSRSKHLCGDT